MKKNKLILVTLFIVLSFTSCTSKKDKIKCQNELKMHLSASNAYDFALKRRNQQKIALDEYIKSIPLEEQICQLFIENLEGSKKFIPVERMNSINEKFSKDSFIIPGGYIYFSYNIADDAESVMKFNDSIYDYCIENGKLPPYLSADQEGGYVCRLKKICTPLPSCLDVAKTYDLKDAAQLYKNQALQMKALGFHMNLAPVVEICTELNKDFLDTRSFGSKDDVINYGKVCVSSYEENKIATVLKHFPGNTNTDPHKGLPVITLSKDELFETLESFRQIIKLEPSAVLMSHAITSAIDDSVPSCLSSYWIKDVLRNQFGFDGLIISDDIFMGALADNGYPPEKAAVLAIESGIDCIMISEKRIALPVKVLYEKACSDEQFAKLIESAAKRVIAYKIDAGILKYVYQSDGSYRICPSNIDSIENRLKNF